MLQISIEFIFQRNNHSTVVKQEFVQKSESPCNILTQ